MRLIQARYVPEFIDSYRFIDFARCSSRILGSSDAQQ
jgi:hypothetical protein